MKLEIAGKYKAVFGEGPIWHAKWGLLWLDIAAQKIIALNIKDNTDTVFDAGGWIKSIIPTNSGNLIAVYKEGLYLLDLEKETRQWLCAPQGLNNMHYLNDAKCGFDGSIWVGSSDGNFKAFKENRETASLPYPSQTSFLYRIDQEFNINIAKEKIAISNGMDWDRAEQKFYYIDSAKQAIHQYDVSNTGELENEQLIYKFDVLEGFPDGMTIDQNGNLWVAIFKSGILALNSSNTSKVVQINPHTKSILCEIVLPVSHVTSCTIGGENLDTLYITTAFEPLPEAKREEQPLAGHLISVKINIKGVEPYIFDVSKLGSYS